MASEHIAGGLERRTADVNRARQNPNQPTQRLQEVGEKTQRLRKRPAK